MNISWTVLIGGVGLIGLISSSDAETATPKTGKAETMASKGATRILGNWNDPGPLLKCNISIEEKAGRYTSVSLCKDLSPNLIRRALVKIGPNSYRWDLRPAKPPPWYYVIGASGDLESWDADGPVRTAVSTGGKDSAQLAAQKKTEEKILLLDRKAEGVSIGMTGSDVRQSSWGKPLKVNRTSTANGTREQWVYRGGYLYFENGSLTAIQN